MGEETENQEQERFFQQTSALALQHLSQLTGRSKAKLFSKVHFSSVKIVILHQVFLIQSP